MMRCDYLLLTALDDESRALAEALAQVGARGPQRHREREVPTFFVWSLGHRLGELTIATASLLDMGNEAAAEYVQRLLKTLDPTYLGLIGIAGAADDQTPPGRVIIADKVWHYEPAKVRPDRVDHRGPVHPSGRFLLDRLKHIDLVQAAQWFPNDGPWEVPVIGTIASGDKVIASKAVRDQLRKAGRNVVAFEMEGHAFAAVIERALGSDQWFMVRSIQDAADETKDDSHRNLACRRAATYAVAFLLDSDLCLPAKPTPPLAAEHDRTTPEVATAIDTGSKAYEELAMRLARRLAAIDAAALLATLKDTAPKLATSPEWALVTAEAAWRLRDFERCLVATSPLAPDLLKGTEQLGGAQAGVLRLLAWSEWKNGNTARAKAILGQLHRVQDVSERARWADLVATIRRFDPAENWLAVVAMYQQSFALKEAAGDGLGQAITLQNIAFTYLEILDYAHARDYFRRLLDLARAESDASIRRSTCIACLALAWIDLMSGGPGEVAASGTYLALAGRAMGAPDSGIPTELRRTARTLAQLSRQRRGQQFVLPRPEQRGFWPRVVLAQIRVLRGEEPAKLASELLSDEREPLLAPHRIPGIIAAVGATTSRVGGPEQLIERKEAGTAPWPLSNWLRYDLVDPSAAVQFLEGVAHLYAAILRTTEASGSEVDTSTDRALGGQARFISSWAERHRDHPLGEEAALVGALLKEASGSRNVLAHAVLGQDLSRAKLKLTSTAVRLADELRHLRGARWVELEPPTLQIAGCSLQFDSSVVRAEGGRLRLILGSATLEADEVVSTSGAINDDREIGKTEIQK